MTTPLNQTKVFTAIGLDFETGGLDSTAHACTQLAMQAIRLDTLKTINRYVTYIHPYEKQELGGKPKRKVLRNKYEMERERRQFMEYQEVALSYSGITMEMLYKSGVKLEEVANDFIRFAERNTLSKGAQHKPY